MTPQQDARKHTKFDTCENHRWLDSERSGRRAEFFIEGGPASGPPCVAAKPCRMWPGTDLFVVEICFGEYALDWAVNQPATTREANG